MDNNQEEKCKQNALEAVRVIDLQLAILAQDMTRLAGEADKIRSQLGDGNLPNALMDAYTALAGLAEKGRLSSGGVHIFTDVSVCLADIKRLD